MQFDDVILGRRSIRGYKPDPVPKQLIMEIIGLAMRAPSSMNTQPWNFYVISGEPLDRIRAGNTERMVTGVPQSREFRTGQPFAANHHGVVPDLLTTAKALGNGFPCAALLMTPQLSAQLPVDDGDGLLAVSDQVGEGKVHTGIREDGLCRGDPQLHFPAFVVGDLSGEVLRIEDRGAHDDDGDQGQERSPIQ